MTRDAKTSPHAARRGAPAHLALALLAATTAGACNQQPNAGGGGSTSATTAPGNSSPADAGGAGTRADGPPIVLRGAPPGGVLEVPIGAAVQGALETGDQLLVDGSAGDDYTIMLREGEPVTIVTRGGPMVGGDAGNATLDVQTLLLFNGREVASDDDSAANGPAMNSRIVYSPVVSGLYVIRVTTSGSGLKLGSYVLQVYRGGLLRQQ